jgi:hypothetical protein
MGGRHSIASKERAAIVKVREQHIEEGVAQLLGKLGRLRDILPAGSRVMIRPSFVFPPRIGA